MTASTELVVATRAASLPDKIAYARELAHAGLLPDAYRKQPANVLYAIEYGAMLGLSPMAAINGLHVIKGKPTASAGMMSALIRREGHRLRVSCDGTTAVCEITRSDDPEFVFRSVWTHERAIQAGLMEIRDGKPWSRDKDGKPTAWEKYTPSMLKARSISECSRDACEEALMGVHYTAEEVGADVDEDGAPISTTPIVQLVPDEQPDEPNWDLLIVQHETDRSRDGLADLWKLARGIRPNDAELLERIAAAGERVRTGAAVEPVEAEIVEDDPAQPVDEDVKRRERRMFALLREAGVGSDRDRRLALLGVILRREVTASSELSHDDRGAVIDELERWKAAGPIGDAAVDRLSEAAELAALDAHRDAEEAARAEGGR